MKSIGLIILLFGFSIASSTQSEAQSANDPNLNVIKSNLISIVRVDVSRLYTPPRNDGPHINAEVIPPTYEWQGKVELEVQNTGNESVKSIDWEFILTTEAPAQKITRYYRISSRKTIRPGQIAKVTGWAINSNLKELREPLKRGLLRGKAEIKRVNYANGGIWSPLQ